ncbi:MAG TPA: methyltransferase domain-containing protein [Alphaproteobacteria bacterium]|nr:methyltransferase domain-containing protein [Alphaproteobacteria bacterium]
MNEGQAIDIEEMMKRMQQGQGSLPVAAVKPPFEGSVAADLASLQSSHDIYHLHFTSHRKILGWLVVSTKRVLQKLLTPVLERQLTYNAANLRIASSLWERSEALLEKIHGAQRDQNAAVQALRELTAQMHEQGTALQGLQDEVGEQLGALHQEQAAVLQALRGEVAEQLGRAQQQQAAVLQALREEVAQQLERAQQEQVAALQALRGEQEQMAALQALREEVAQQLGRAQQEQMAALQALRGELTAQIEAMHQAHAAALQTLRERSSRAERRVRRFLHALTDGQPTDSGPMPKPSLEQRKTLSQSFEPEFDYFGLEERFRGSEGDIKDRQRIYVEYFKGLDQVLDIGSGRGEFLELLMEAGIKAKGVDLDLDMVLYCQEKGLDVVREDAFVYLESLPDESLGGIFAAQVIEHLEPLRIVELVKLCQRKLRPGGPLIFETPNPACLMVFARSFYMDPSHIRPIHPETMKFVLESAGFEDLQLRFSAPVEAVMRIPPLAGSGADGLTLEEFNKGIERLNELLYGCQDYAVIGRKSCHP